MRNLHGMEKKRKAGESYLGFCIKPLGDTICTWRSGKQPEEIQVYIYDLDCGLGIQNNG